MANWSIPPLLKQALSDEAGRDLLVDLLVLRGLVAGQPVARVRRLRTRRDRERLRLWLVAAAAGTVGAFGVLGG